MQQADTARNEPTCSHSYGVKYRQVCHGPSVSDTDAHSLIVGYPTKSNASEFVWKFPGQNNSVE